MAEKHGTVRRIGADDELVMLEDGKEIATIERAEGGRFKILAKSERRLDFVRRKRANLDRVFDLRNGQQSFTGR